MKYFRYLRKKIEFSFPDGASGPNLVQSETLPYEGEILYIQQRNGANTNSRTAQLQIADGDGYVLWDGGAKAANNVFSHEFATTRRCLTADNRLQCTISGDPGEGGYQVVAVLYLWGRDG